MTDNEIVKALKEILELMLNEGDLQRASTISKVLNLINRQKEEIKDIKFLYENLKEEHLEIIKAIKHTKSEAYKEFAEGFVTALVDTYDLKSMQIGNIEKIKNNLLKELVGDENEGN